MNRPSPHPIDALLEGLRAERPELRIAVGYRDLSGHHTYLNGADDWFHAASTMKLAVAVQAMRMADAGNYDLDGQVSVTNAFQSLVDDVAFAVTPESDNATELYERIGLRVPRAELLQLMLASSSNLATNLLLRDIGLQHLAPMLASLGASEVVIIRGVEDLLAHRAGLVNKATARGLLNLITAIGEHRAARAPSCIKLLAMLQTRDHEGLVREALDGDVQVASKGGQIARIEHDVAIVTLRDGSRYSVVILTEGLEPREQALETGRAVARGLHDWHVERRARLQSSS